MPNSEAGTSEPEPAKVRSFVIFFSGAIGGVALDILTLYVRGFPTPGGNTSIELWAAGVVLRVALFMALTGFLAILYADGRLRNAFVIGVAAPSILLNIAASFRPPNPSGQANATVTAPGQPGPSVPAIPSTPTPSQPGPFVPTIPSSPVPGGSPRPSSWFPRIGPASAEAQTGAVVQDASYGQVQVNLGLPEDWIAKSPGHLKIKDAHTGNVIATTTPPSASFAFLLPKGSYKLKYEGPVGHSETQKVQVQPGQVNLVKLPVKSKELPEEWKKTWAASDLWRGATDRLDGVVQVKEATSVLK